MSSPRIFRSCSSLSFSRSCPSNIMDPLICELRARVSPIVVNDETLFPEPDSPTIPSVLPA